MAVAFLSLVKRSCHFDRRRFGRDIDRFQPAAPKPQPVKPKANAPSHSRVSVQQEAFDDSDDDLSDDDVHVKTEDDCDDIEAPMPAPSKRAKLESGIELFARSVNGDDDGDAASGPEDKVRAHVRAMREFRRVHRIHVSGTDIPDPMPSFQALTDRYEMPAYLLRNLTAPVPEGLGYTAPTPVQMQAIPVMLNDRECVACAPTGEGKTVAFLLPLLLSLQQPQHKGIRAIVVSPTRELAQQTLTVANKLTHGQQWSVTLLSKSNIHDLTFRAAHSDRRDIIISTPLTLQHLFESNIDIHLQSLKHIVLDEADRLLDLGFLPQIDKILSLIQAKSNNVRNYSLHLFSATLPMSIDGMITTLLMDPVKVIIAHRNTAQSHVKQELKFVGTEDGKMLAMKTMIADGLTVPMIIFVQSSERARQLHTALTQQCHVTNIGIIHGDMPEMQRLTVIDQFRSGEYALLIATDILSRGIDLKPVQCVLNYDFPQSTVSYIHRIGRTGRAGRQGHAVTFFTHSDRPLLRYVAGVMAHSGADIPQWIIDIKKGSEKKVKQLATHAPPREPIVRGEKKDKKKQHKKRKRTVSDSENVSDGPVDGSEAADDDTEAIIAASKPKAKVQKVFHSNSNGGSEANGATAAKPKRTTRSNENGALSASPSKPSTNGTPARAVIARRKSAKAAR